MKIILADFGEAEIEDWYRPFLIDDIKKFGFKVPKLLEALEHGDEIIKLDKEESEKFVVMVELLDAWYGGGITD